MRKTKRSPEKISWENMRSRCNPTTKQGKKWPQYVEKGCCERWSIFSNFFKDMGPRPPGYTLERIDNSLGYFPENCKWATRSEQSNNTARNINVYFNGKTKNLAEWAKHYGLNYGSLIGACASGKAGDYETLRYFVLRKHGLIPPA